MTEEEIKINVMRFKDKFDKANDFFKKRNVQIALVLILFAILLGSATLIRFSGLPNLVDQTTGHYLFADPDAFYEYRVAETIVNHNDISGIDPMRNPGLNLFYTQEMLPKILALTYDLVIRFNPSITLDYIDVIYPIVAFAIGLTVFFILCWYLSKSKFFALLASTMLAYSTSYFQRTAAGISSHEALGLVFMFLAFLAYAFSINNYKRSWKWTASLGALTGISLALSLFSWSGGSNFALIIFPLSSLIFYLFGTEENRELKKKFIAFNILWVFSSIAMMPIIGYPLNAITSKFLSNYGIITPVLIIFMIFDFFLETYSQKIKLVQGKNRIWYSIFGAIIVGLTGLALIGKNPINLIVGIYNQLLFPFGQGRVGLTVAYYAQPYLNDLINQIGKAIFWVFFLGMAAIGIEFGKKISSKKNKNYFYLIWILAISGMLFTRISSSSFFNGTNFFSSLFYVLSFLILGLYVIWLYSNEKFSIDGRIVFIFSWMIVTLISARSAVRVFFTVVIFVFFAASFFIIKTYEYGRKTENKNLKYFLFAVSIVSLLITLNFVFGNPFSGTTGNYQAVSYSALNSGPITNVQWQKSMAWVRNNTSSDSVFVSWWDYGYMIQTLGDRTSVLDGGNINAYWDHLVGRYLLTESNPDASLSFMKTHNVSYLLIDPTDFGKYPAYSKIGSDDSGGDRFAQIPIIISDPSQTQTSGNTSTIVYRGGTFVDEDMIYNLNGSQIFLPSGNSFMGAIVLSTSKGNGSISFNQPQGIFAYNQKQINLPIRYIYLNGKIIDFGSGIDSIVDIIPYVEQTNQKISINNLGAVIYLSPKVSKSLFAQLYLLNDAFGNYPSIKAADSQPDQIADSLNSQGANVGDFVYFGGFRGPLKIWKVDYPPNIISQEEFMNPSGDYAEFDNLTFSKTN